MAKDKCPKCGLELSPLYLKATCPKCGTNLMYYEMEQRLEQDEINAAREVEKVGQLGLGIKASSVGSVLPIVRLVSYVLLIAATLLPVFNGGVFGTASDSSVGLIQLIGAMTAENADMMAVLFGSATSIYGTVIFFGTVLIALISLIVSLFSFTKNGLVRNIIFSFVALLVSVVPAVLLMTGSGVALGLGLYVIAGLEIVILVLNILIGKQLKKREDS